MSLDTFSTLRQRFNYLVGDTSSSTSGIIDSHINAAIADICNAYPFSWNITNTNGTTIASSNTEYSQFNIASDYNPKWHMHDVRITASVAGQDKRFTEVVINDQNIYASGSYKYWITYDTANKVYVFNCTEPVGTLVTYYYYFKPVTMTAVSDSSIVPDSEAVCYLAASKNWLTDERNQALSTYYKQEASTRIQSMYQTDNAFGPVPVEGSAVDYQYYLGRR